MTDGKDKTWFPAAMSLARRWSWSVVTSCGLGTRPSATVLHLSIITSVRGWMIVANELTYSLVIMLCCWAVASVEESSQLSRPPAAGSGKMYNLDESVTVWSDFLHPHIHPRSVHIVDTYQHNRQAHQCSSLHLICRFLTRDVCISCEEWSVSPRNMRRWN